jgi:tetratricopeptide (TPR) repeat protein
MAQVSQLQRSPFRQRILVSATACALALCLAPAGAQETDIAQQAREAAWAGRTTEALRLMDQHLATYPDDRAARLDRARYLSWNGDYAAAIEALDALGADDDDARAVRARVMAWAGRRDAALALNTPLYEAAPDEYDYAWTQALAERLGYRPESALPPLETVRRLQPDGPDSLSLTKSVRLPLFSSVGLPASVYEDSDDIEIRSVGLEGSLRLSDAWRVMAAGARRDHSAPVTGPFAPVNGGDSLDETRAQVGVRYSATPDVAVDLWLGRSALDGDNGFDDDDTIGQLALSHQASDTFGYALSVDRDRVAASPRALSLGVMRTGAAANLQWQPSLRDAVTTRLGFDDFNDGNRRHTLDAEYRRAFHRGPRANLDLGAQLEWQGNSRDTGNGYYSPDRYVRLAPMASSYIKLSEEAGLYLAAAVGVQRDDTFDSWKRASDVSAELTLGIFTRWQLVARAGYSERLNEFGRYEGRNFGLALRYRFCELRADRCP